MKKKLTLLVAIITVIAIFVGAGCSFIMPKYTVGVGIESIEKTASEGLVDTYTITYTDGTTTTFEVTNGRDGTDGEQGEKGDRGEKGEDGLSTAISVRSIEKTSTLGLVDTYTITYTDGTTTTFNVTNGSNGASGSDGKDVTATDLYETYKAETGDDITYAEFLAIYLNIDEAEDQAIVINESLRSCGLVYAEYLEYDTDTAPEYDVTTSFSQGSCVVYAVEEDYVYFLTNNHVVSHSDALREVKLTCYLYGSEGGPQATEDVFGAIYYEYGPYAIPCEVVGGSDEYDVAILRASASTVKAINPEVRAITFAEDYYVGETAIAIGNPNGEGISVTQGIVSVDNELINMATDGTVRAYRCIRVDTSLYHGSSGGGLFNARGELIGITNGGDTAHQNVNYALPVLAVKSASENIMRHYRDGDDSTSGVYKTTIGVTVTGQNAKYVYDETCGYGKIMEDVTVTLITAGSKAEAMGLVVGDVIRGIKIDGEQYEIMRHYDIGEHVPYLTSGVTFSFIFERAGERLETLTYTVNSSDLMRAE